MANASDSEFLNSISDFDLTLLGSFDNSVEINELSSESNNPITLTSNSIDISHSSVAYVNQQRLLIERIIELEERLNIFQFAFWKVSSDKAINILCNLCGLIFGKTFSKDEFKVVRELDSRRRGVLMRVRSLELKQNILSKETHFKSYGYSVDIY